MKYLNTRGHRSAGWILALSAFAFAFALPMGANAQWTVIQLHPAGATGSEAVGVDGGKQVGYATVGGIRRASLWSGTAASWVDLHPAGMAGSFASDVGGGQQVGYVIDGYGDHHAGLWSGTPESWVDLHPAGAEQSLATGVDGAEQVGYSYFDGLPRASLWNAAGSWVNLNPYWATESRARQVDGGQQVGSATDAEGVLHAVLWTGDADSWVDLHPGTASLSAATGVGGGQQVGYAKVVGAFHAGLWTGDADSWVDLHPPGVNTNSEAFDVDGGQQVGVVFNNDPYHASLWSGTAESWVDLHAFLPRKFTSSMARGIWHDATYTYVVGYGYNSKRQRNEALMWRADYSPPPPEPGEVTVDLLSPNTMSAGTMIYVTITGSDFQPGATVTFENGSGPEPTADVTDVSLEGFEIEATITVRGGGPQGTRVWDVRVTNPDNSTGTLTAGFTVIR